MESDILRLAAEKIKDSDTIIVTAGAGIGVDSGLPDFRGDKGFWRAYPHYERLGLSFVDCANPIHFSSDPAFGWGFYGHRLNMYRDVTPHKGFYIMKRWIDSMGKRYFVVTSNVDGHFQKAGYEDDHIYEIHGSIHYLQCIKPCGGDIWENNELIEVDFDTMRAKNIPKCIKCGGVARPNILMFGDFGWISDRSDEQRWRYDRFIDEVKDSRIVVIEIGAGTAIPSIRYTSERIVQRFDAFLIRINVREYEIPSNLLKKGIGFPVGALKTLTELDKIVDAL